MIYKYLRHKLMTGAKYKVWLEHIRDSPCCYCQAPAPSDPHHIFGSMGSVKSSDIMTIPLCRKCHNEIQHDASRKEEMIARWVEIAHSELSLIYTIMGENRRKNKSSVSV